VVSLIEWRLEQMISAQDNMDLDVNSKRLLGAVSILNAVTGSLPQIVADELLLKSIYILDKYVNFDEGGLFTSAFRFDYAPPWLRGDCEATGLLNKAIGAIIRLNEEPLHIQDFTFKHLGFLHAGKYSCDDGTSFYSDLLSCAKGINLLLCRDPASDFSKKFTLAVAQGLAGHDEWKLKGKKNYFE